MTQGECLTALFMALANRSPYQWQAAAFERLMAADLPGQIKVPTAAGKTMILPIFVAALAAQAMTGKVTLPRRLVHVVNRRVLVDEASRLAGNIVQALAAAPALRPMRDALAALSASGCPLAVSTLRGGVDDNGEWSIDPSTPALILATPAMLGSRLLFRGYGVGRSRSATHAGLLGCDTLVVHDEAHLAPAFTALLRQVEVLAAPGAVAIGRPALSVIEMTATLSTGSAVQPLVCDVAADLDLAERMSAAKRLHLSDARLVPSKASKPLTQVLDALGDLALAHKSDNRAVALFVSSPAAAELVAGRLLKAGVAPELVLMLTGTMRGHERAGLSSAPVFRRFDPGPERTDDGSAYFIATSAGEIGLDIDADLGLFDLTTLDRFIQRAGRVNRRGLGVGQIHVVHAGGEELPGVLQARAGAALQCLTGLPLVNGTADASPLALSALCERPDFADAIEPPPAIRRLEPAVVQMFSMTSLRLDQLRCPSPDVFIHGVVEEDAQLNLAWRRLPAAGADLAEWLDVWPMLPAELAKLPIDPARRMLKERLLSVQAGDGHLLAIALDGQGMPTGDEPMLLVGARVERWVNRLRPGLTVLMTCNAGGLTMQGQPSALAAETVADVSCGGALLVSDRTEIRSIAVAHRVADESSEWVSEGHTAPTLDEWLKDEIGDLDLVFHDGPRLTEATSWDGTITLWLSRRTPRTPDAGDLASLLGRDRLLEVHLDLTARAARRLVNCLGLRPELASAQVRAAAEHDRGKAWERWQRAIGNTNLAAPLGKSARAAFSFKINDGYRHELGSVVDRGASFSTLERHLVAAHHGWARPGFRPDALTKPGCAAAADAVAGGFTDLTDALGPWAVAYLEAVLKAADVHAELMDLSLAAEAPLQLPIAATFPAPATLVPKRFHLHADALNFGEYLAALGLAALVGQQGHSVLLGWDVGRFVMAGVSSDDVASVLGCLRRTRVVHDVAATAVAQRDGAYPPLQLVLGDGSSLALNHWLDERFLTSSRWKLGAGQTSAAKTLASVAQACSALLERDDFQPDRLFSQGGGLVGADASKFRFDAATNWSARDAGFSLNESDAFKSTRPWVELLSAIGLQHFFLPPADLRPGYYTWRGLLPPMLALAAARGLMPQSGDGLMPVINPSGKMKDVFTSKPILREASNPCPPQFLVI